MKLGHCCVDGCPRPGRWQLWTGASPDDFTESCEGHVAELLGDSELVAIVDLSVADGT